MDLERLKRISGINESLTLKTVTPSTDTSKSVKSAEKQAKINNTTPKNKSAADVRTVDSKSDIAQNTKGTVLDDTDESKITKMKSGKTDAGGQRTVAKHEKLNYTISIDPKTGCPKVDDQLKKEMIDVESWSSNVSYTECYVIASPENVYVCYEADTDVDNFIMLDDRNKAVVFETIEQAQMVADLFDNSTIRQLTIQEAKKTEVMCKKCKCCPCECEENEEVQSEDGEDYVSTGEENCEMKESQSLPTTFGSMSLSQYVAVIKESKKENDKVTINNLVAKHAGKFNKSAVFRDRKKDDKRGVKKHKDDKINDE